MGRIEKGFMNVFTGIIGQVMLLILNFIVRTIFIFYLDKTFLGLNSLFNSILTVLNVAELGIGTAIIFYMFRTVADGNEEKTKQYLYFYKKTYRIIGTFILIAGLIIMPFLPVLINGEMPPINVYLVFFLYLMNAVSSYWLFAYRLSLLTANQDTYKMSLVLYAQIIVTSILQLLGLVFFQSLYLFLIIPIVTLFVFSIIKGILIGRFYPYILIPPESKLSNDEKKEIQKNVYALILYKVSTAIADASDTVLLSAMVGLAIVAIYSNYLLITVSLIAFLNIFQNAFISGIGNLNVTETKERKHISFKSLDFANFWLYSFCGITIYVLFTPFIRLWLSNEDFLLSNITEIIIILCFVLVGSLGIVFAYRQACGLFYVGRYRAPIAALVNLVISILLIIFLPDYLAVAGVLLGTIISKIFIIYLYDIWLVHKYVFEEKSKYYFIKYIIRILFVCALGGLVKYICSLYNFSPFINLIAMLGTCLIVINGLYLLIFWRTKEFKYWKNVALKKIFKMLKKS